MGGRDLAIKVLRQHKSVLTNNIRLRWLENIQSSSMIPVGMETVSPYAALSFVRKRTSQKGRPTKTDTDYLKTLHFLRKDWGSCDWRRKISRRQVKENAQFKDYGFYLHPLKNEDYFFTLCTAFNLEPNENGVVSVTCLHLAIMDNTIETLLELGANAQETIVPMEILRNRNTGYEQNIMLKCKSIRTEITGYYKRCDPPLKEGDPIYKYNIVDLWLVPSAD